MNYKYTFLSKCHTRTTLVENVTMHVIYVFRLREIPTGRTTLNRKLHGPRNRTVMDTGWETTLLISVTSVFYSPSDARKAHVCVCVCVCRWGTGQVAARYDLDVTVGAVPPLLSKCPCICITRTAVAMQDCLSICLCDRAAASFSQMSDSLEHLWLRS